MGAAVSIPPLLPVRLEPRAAIFRATPVLQRFLRHVERFERGPAQILLRGLHFIDAQRRAMRLRRVLLVRAPRGSPHKQDTAEAHGAPLGVDEVKATKQNLGWPSLEPFYVPEEALEHWRRAKDRGARLESDWQKRWDGYRSAHPDLATELERRLAGQLPAGWDAALPVFGPKDAQATRAASGKVLNAIAAKVPELIGGSGDLTGSNNTEIKGGGVFAAAARTGRNFHYGGGDHSIGAALNGITLHGGFIPFGGTFLIFSDYMRPSILLAALPPLKPIYVFTHDSIGLGEDGPTHQPIEQLAALHAIPNMTVIRPSDPTEAVEAG